MALRTAVAARNSQIYHSEGVTEFREQIEQRTEQGFDLDSLEEAARRRIGSLGRLVMRHEAQTVRRQAALGAVADTMVSVINQAAICEGPSYGRLASWFIDKARREGEPDVAEYGLRAYAHCSSDAVYALHRQLREAIASAVAIPTDDSN